MKLTTKEKKFMKELTIGTEKEIVRNRFGGDSIELKPEAVALYDFIIGAEFMLYTQQNLTNETIKEAEEKFFIAKDIFIKNWPNAYMILLD
jgi:hypothetical protein